jgi:hypothetical protein
MMRMVIFRCSPSFPRKNLIRPIATQDEYEKVPVSIAEMVEHWNGQFCLKGITSAADAKRAVDVGCTGIVVSNHGGRQLDGSRASFAMARPVTFALDVSQQGGRMNDGRHLGKKAPRSGAIAFEPFSLTLRLC